MQNLKMWGIELNKVVNNNLKQECDSNKLIENLHSMNIKLFEKAMVDFYSNPENYELLKNINLEISASDANLKSYEDWIKLNGNKRN